MALGFPMEITYLAPLPLGLCMYPQGNSLGKFSQMKIIKQEAPLHETTEIVAQVSGKT